MTGPALGLCLNALSLFGLCLNLYILIVVLISKQTEGGGGRILLGHLGLTGALLCLLTLLSGLPIPCPVTGCLFTLLHPVSLYTLCGLNCDRYAAIAAPLHYAQLVKPRKVVVGLCLAWLLSIGLALPPLFISEYTYSKDLFACSPELNVKGGLWYSAVYTALTLLLPTAVIMACNLKVLMIARYHRHRIARAIFEVTLSAQVTITHQKNPFVVSSGSGRGRSPTATVLQLVGSVVVLYSPYYCLLLWQGLGRKPSPGLMTVATGLLACAPTLNGLLYGLKNKLLRRAFSHYWRKKMTKNELEQEIQARTPSRRPSLTPQKVHAWKRIGSPDPTNFKTRIEYIFGSELMPDQNLLQVWRPISTSALGASPNRLGGSLRHSATSTSILAARSKPRITITSDDGPTPPVRIKIGGSSSSVSGDSDLTQEEREWRWMAASSSSLPAATATFFPYFTSFECIRSGSETGLMDSVIAL